MKMIAQQLRDDLLGASQQDTSTYTGQTEALKKTEAQEQESIDAYKNMLRRSYQLLLDPCQGNPYKIYENESKNLELYTKEQLKNKKKRNNNKKRH